MQAFASAYTNVYFALGACDGFIAPQKEAPFDPHGPMLAPWPDSFKRQMSEIRESGRIEGGNLAKQHGFTVAERAELCRSQLNDAEADLNKVRAQYVR